MSISNFRLQTKTLWQLTVIAALVVPNCLSADNHTQAASVQAINGGDLVPIGRHEAVGMLGGCSASLISDRLVLTAAHCVCPEDASPRGCQARATFTLTDVVRRDDPATLANEEESRGNVPLSGNVRVYERYGAPEMPGAGPLWLSNDFALVDLDRRASELAVVEPLSVALPRNTPLLGEALTLVGFGRTGAGCVDPSGIKRELTLPLWNIHTDNPTLSIGTREMGACPGDSGGPAINAGGEIVGVASSLPGNYDPTSLAANFVAGFRDLRGKINGTPSAVHTVSDRIEVFVRGGHQNELVQRSWDGSKWSGWKNLGGGLGGTPTAVYMGNDRIEIFARGNIDGPLFQKSWDGASWSDWQSLGGKISGTPTAVETGNGRIEVFARRSGTHELLQKSWNGSSWSDWIDLGGDLADSPTAVHVGAGQVEVFIRGAHNDELVQRSWDGTAWSGWKNLGGDIASAPSAVHLGNGRIEVFVRGAHNHELVRRVWNGSSWSGWNNLGGDIASAPAVVVDGNGRIEVYAMGQRGELLQLRR